MKYQYIDTVTESIITEGTKQECETARVYHWYKNCKVVEIMEVTDVPF